MKINSGNRLAGSEIKFTTTMNTQYLIGEIFSIDVNNRYKSNLMHSTTNSHGHIFINLRMYFDGEERVIGYNLTLENFTWYIYNDKWKEFKCIDRRLILDKVVKVSIDNMIYELQNDSYTRKNFRKLKQDKSIRFIWDMGMINGYKKECDELIRVCRNLS